jgi:hypothetical protein
MVLSSLTKTGDAHDSLSRLLELPNHPKTRMLNGLVEFCADDFWSAKSFSYRIKDLGKVRSHFRDCTIQEPARALANLPEKLQSEVWATAFKCDA